MLVGAAAVHGQDIRSLNDGWLFHPGECPAAADAGFDDSCWEPVHLPHTWNTDAYTVKDYYRGTGWYRRSLHIPGQWAGKRIFLKLEGANKAAAIFLNGKAVASHAGGYTACMTDLTPYLFAGGENQLAIRVNNAREDIPPISGDFTFFGGIYRDVWLVATEAQHFSRTDYGVESVRITTPRVTEAEALLSVCSEVVNDAGGQASVELLTILHAPDGSLLQTLRQTVHLKSGERRMVRQESRPVCRPLLWTPETPHCYAVTVELRNPANGKLLDRSVHYTGFRWFHFDGQKGFFLNGKPYKLRGVCRHQDQKPIGPALTDEMHRRDFQLMKEMGANFIRIAHYPQDEALLEMCDRKGMLVWEEIPIIDIVPDTPGYDNNCERNLREMIRQHYNHPSVIAWGYMNEILLVAQRRFPTAEALQPTLQHTLTLARRLEQALKEEDSTRVSAMAFHASQLYNETGLSQITDIVGWNLYSGWYGGDLTGFERFLAEQQQAWPDHPLIVSEYGAGSDRRLHTLHPRPFDFSSEYQQIYLEHYLPVLENTPYVCGGAHWNFIDFSSALRDESMPRINNKGLVYADRTPKDVYYYYQAAWRNDIPVLHIASRDWTHRYAICRGDSAAYMPVKVYTNLPEVELYADGRSLGCKPVINHQAVFDVPFANPGVCLSARGIRQGQPVYDVLQLPFTAVPDRADDAVRTLSELAVNVGSDCFFTSDVSGLTWLPDRPYQTGGWGYIGGEAQSTQTEIALTPDGPLFQTLREGLTAYRFDVSPGLYEVELLFADIFRSGEASAYQLGRNDVRQEGQNAFHIYCNGTLLEDSFSPAAQSGPFRAVRKKYIVRNDSDHLLIQWEVTAGKAFLNGIKLRLMQNQSSNNQ